MKTGIMVLTDQLPEGWQIVEHREVEALAAIEAHRDWDARRKVLLETVLWMQGRGLHQIASEMWDDLIGPEPTDG